MTFTVAIVGRPNVGKSTLFNRLVGRRLALVDDQPGVTRDRREGRGRLGDLNFAVIDTAGLEQADWQTRRDIITTLVKRVEIDTEQVNIVYRVDTRPFDPGPNRGILHYCRRAAGSAPTKTRPSACHTLDKSH